MLQTFIQIVHIFVCLVLMFVVLLQQGKGGGMGAAFGGATSQVFGGRGAGNLLTRTTAICAAVFMLTSVSLAYLSSSGDRALKARVAQEQTKTKDQGQKREKQDSPPATTGAAAPAGTDATGTGTGTSTGTTTGTPAAPATPDEAPQAPAPAGGEAPKP